MQGMGLVIKVGNVEEFPEPPPYFPKCGGYTYHHSDRQRTCPTPQCPISEAGQTRLFPRIVLFAVFSLLFT